MPYTFWAITPIKEPSVVRSTAYGVCRAFFPEFKEATDGERGISILNREIKKQVYPDGVNKELDPHYHLAAINIFCKALRMADVNGFRQEFPCRIREY